MRMSGRSPDASIRLNFSCEPFDSIISMKSTCTLVRSSRKVVNAASSGVPDDVLDE